MLAETKERAAAYRATADGLVTLGPELTELMMRLDARICEWAREIQAAPMIFPPLMRVSDLDRLDYFRNFPHLGMVVTGIRSDHQAELTAKARHTHVAAGHVCDGHHLLPSAACYNIYLDLDGTVLDRPRYVTTAARCFRREEHYDGLRRLAGFTMREIVCIGPAASVQEHLKSFRRRIAEFAGAIDLPLSIKPATDPFFSQDSARLAMQSLFPVKEEFLYGDGLAIASVNFHRNFFGEKCGISLAEGGPAFSGCVAFGLERWLHALLDRYDGDMPRIIATLAL
jgi:seryl-tRNA synthetase